MNSKDKVIEIAKKEIEITTGLSYEDYEKLDIDEQIRILHSLKNRWRKYRIDKRDCTAGSLIDNELLYRIKYYFKDAKYSIKRISVKTLDKIKKR